jgi:diguanylate cyclase (GGDEF)-like protein/PAS domain S-box-containing protein
MADQANVPSDGDDIVATGPHQPSAARAMIDPALLGYLMGPLAFAAVLLLMHFSFITHESAWLWLGVFLAVPSCNFVVDRIYDRRPDPLSLNLRVAVQVAAVSAVIFLTGWGPVLWGAYAFIALEVIAKCGSRSWLSVTVWSLVGMALGQLGIWAGALPSELSVGQSTALSTMGAFVLVFVIRMAGATMEQKEAAEGAVRLSEDRFRSLIQNSSDVTMIIDDEGFFRYLSPAVEQLLGYRPLALVGRRATDYVHPDDQEYLRLRLGDEFQASSDTAVLEFRMLRRDGSCRDVEAVISNQLDRISVGGYVTNVRDITERKKFEELLSHRALHDPLTGLANRQLILERADQMLARSRRSGEQVAAFFIDLDNFKDTNDSLGHEAGDRLLQSVAGRLVGLLRTSDTVGRLGGDEFVVLAEGVSLQDGPEAIADRIRQVLRPAFYVEGFESVPLTVSASVGIAAGDRPSAQELLRDADIALYRAKGAGRDQAVVFEAAMQLAATDRLALRTELDIGLTAGQFTLLYQPIVDLTDLHIEGVEALIRWNHPTKGLVTPDRFIPALEDSGQIVDVGRWVLDEACAQLARWRVLGHRLSMSINASMRQLESDTFVGDVRAALEEHGLDPGDLIIEITETVLMKDAHATVDRLASLKELGVRIAIDDFGTGYSSLAYLRQFPVDVLKIDRTFVAEMTGSPDATALIHTLVELGHTLGLLTLAEGIEHPAQIDGLRSQNCDHGQGYFFSRPVAAEEIELLLDSDVRTDDLVTGTTLRPGPS